MKKSRITILSIMAVICLWLVFPGVHEAAGPKGPGGPGGSKGGGTVKNAAGALYGDLYVLERDGQGVPIKRNITYTAPETNSPVTVSCVQPIGEEGCIPLTEGATALTSCTLLPLNGEKADFNPELEDACGVQLPYAGCVQEVSFGRESVSRSPASVIDKSYSEAVKTLNSSLANACACDYEAGFCSAEGTDSRAIKQDPAGRLTLCIPIEDGSGYQWKTIDAPLENLGLYRETMTKGCFGKVTEQTVGEEGAAVVVTTALDPTAIFYLNSSGLDHLVCAYGTAVPATITQALSQEAACQVTADPVGAAADTPCWWESPVTPSVVTDEDMLSSTVFIASGADKTSPITIDEIINVNTYLGINTWTYTRSRNTQVLNVTYFPFQYPAGAWFTYTRGVDACTTDTQAYLLAATTPTTFAAQYISLFADAANGVDLNSVNITVCRGGAPMTDPADSFCDAASDTSYTGDPPNGCGGANWFAQAAEDSRKVIWYLHNWSVPEIAY